MAKTQWEKKAYLGRKRASAGDDRVRLTTYDRS